MAALPQIQSAIPRKGETREPSGFALWSFRMTPSAPAPMCKSGSLEPRKGFNRSPPALALQAPGPKGRHSFALPQRGHEWPLFHLDAALQFPNRQSFPKYFSLVVLAGIVRTTDCDL